MVGWLDDIGGWERSSGMDLEPGRRWAWKSGYDERCESS